MKITILSFISCLLVCGIGYGSFLIGNKSSSESALDVDVNIGDLADQKVVSFYKEPEVFKVSKETFVDCNDKIAKTGELKYFLQLKNSCVPNIHKYSSANISFSLVICNAPKGIEESFSTDDFFSYSVDDVEPVSLPYEKNNFKDNVYTNKVSISDVASKQSQKIDVCYRFNKKFCDKLDKKITMKFLLNVAYIEK